MRQKNLKSHIKCIKKRKKTSENSNNSLLFMFWCINLKILRKFSKMLRRRAKMTQSWSSSRHVRLCVCLSVCPLPVRFFFRPLIGPHIGPQQSASLTSSSICNFLMKTCVAKPVGVLEELLICSKAKAKPLIGPQIGPPPRRAHPSAIS